MAKHCLNPGQLELYVYLKSCLHRSTKKSVHAHKSPGACNYVLCAGENISLFG